MIDALIDKQDTFEIIRDQIAALLAIETANQQSLATAAAEDPTLWQFRTFRERAVPWPFFQNAEDVVPVVNVWWDSHQVDKPASNLIDRQTMNGSFNLDVYARGLSRGNGAGHIAGDLDATLSAQRIARLVRNIIMSNEYYRLGLPAQTIAQRLISNVQSFQPQQDNQQTVEISGIRLTLDVRFNEFSPQQQAETIETITSTITLDPSGEVIVSQWPGA